MKDLINQLKGTDYYRAFNPTRWFTLMGIPPLPPILLTRDNIGEVNDRINNFCDSLNNYKIERSVIISISQEVNNFLRDLSS